jgi:DNA-binding SARP family transcriptional activator
VPVAAVTALGLLAALSGGVAGATTVGTPFVPARPPVTWPASVQDGGAQTSTVTFDTAELAKGQELPGGAMLSPDQPYLFVALHASYVFSTDPTAPFAMPTTAATLVTPTGSISGIRGQVTSLGIDASWYFPVAADLASATLEVAPFTKVLGNERGDFLTWSFTPTPIGLVAQPIHPATTAPDTNPPSTVTPVRPTPATATTGTGPSTGVVLGAGVAGLLALGGVAASAVSIRRRRAFARADREGRVVLTGPPPLTAASPLVASVLAGGALTPERRGLLVKLLGPLEVEGAGRPVTAGPVLEIIVFLALHPGEQFTSAQLRESIWGLGRRPITSATFRQYLVKFRKAFGPGVIVTDKYRYELTGAVASDWDQFQALVTPMDDESEDLRRRTTALGLVRGPVLHGSFDGKQNSPFAWAVTTAHTIEDTVTALAADVALDYLDHGDPEHASAALASGLRCSDANLRLRMVDLQVGAAAGGQQEVGRRLAGGVAAMAAFPRDIAALEDRARRFGWTAEGHQ